MILPTEKLNVIVVLVRVEIEVAVDFSRSENSSIAVDFL